MPTGEGPSTSASQSDFSLGHSNVQLRLGGGSPGWLVLNVLLRTSDYFSSMILSLFRLSMDGLYSWITICFPPSPFSHPQLSMDGWGYIAFSDNFSTLSFQPSLDCPWMAGDTLYSRITFPPYPSSHPRTLICSSARTSPSFTVALQVQCVIISYREVNLKVHAIS